MKAQSAIHINEGCVLGELILVTYLPQILATVYTPLKFRSRAMRSSSILSPLQRGFLTLALLRTHDLLLYPFKNPRSAHASTNAHRYHSELFVEAVKVVDYLCSEFCAGTSKRVPHSNCPSIDVKFILI